MQTTKKVSFDPVEFYRLSDRYEGLKFPLKYTFVSGLIMGLIFSILTIIGGILGGDFSVTTIISSPVTILTGGLFMVSMVASTTLIQHLFIKLMGGSNWRGTAKIISYASGPTALVGWIPLLGQIFILYLYYNGIKTVHGFSKKKAIIVLVLPYLAIGILIVLVSVLLGGLLFSMLLG